MLCGLRCKEQDVGCRGEGGVKHTLCRLSIWRMSAARPSLCSVCHDSTASTMLLKLACDACAQLGYGLAAAVSRSDLALMRCYKHLPI